MSGLPGKLRTGTRRPVEVSGGPRTPRPPLHTGQGGRPFDPTSLHARRRYLAEPRRHPARDFLYRCRALALLLASILAGPPSLVGQLSTETRALSVDDAMATRTFIGYVPHTVSPRGDLVAYTSVDPARRSAPGVGRELQSQTGSPGAVQGAQLRVAPIGGGPAMTVGPVEGSSWGGTWSPEGDRLAFYSDASGEVGLWIWERATGEAREVPSRPGLPYFGFELPQWMPDGGQILIKVIPRGRSLNEHLAWIDGRDDPGTDVVQVLASETEGVEGDCSSPDLPRGLRALVADLVLISLPDGAETVVAAGVPTYGYWLSPDGGKIAVMEARSLGECARWGLRFDLWTTEVGGDRWVVAIDLEQPFGISVSWSPDSSRLAFTQATPGRGGFGLVFAQPGVSDVVLSVGLPGVPPVLDPPVWDGDMVYLVADNRLWGVGAAGDIHVEVEPPYGVRLHRVVAGGTAPAGQGRTAPVLQGRDGETLEAVLLRWDGDERSLNTMLRIGWFIPDRPGSFAWAGRALIFRAEGTNSPQDLWMLEPGRDPVRLTQENPHLKGLAFGEPRLVRYRAGHGQELRGALFLPAEHREGVPVPLVTIVYGGALSSEVMHRFGEFGMTMLLHPFLNAMGFAVLYPDLPLDVGTPMSDLARMVVPAMDHIVALGVADPDRLAVLGVSYGGYTALSVAVQARHLRGAVVIAGFGDMLQQYTGGAPGEVEGVVWSEGGQGRMGGTPWDHRERYIENSPFFYFDRVAASVLLVHGTADPAVRVAAADATYLGLRRLGKDVEYLRYPEQGHAVWSWEASHDFLTRLADWLQRHVGAPAAGR